MTKYIIGILTVGALSLVTLLFVWSNKIDRLEADLNKAEQRNSELTAQNTQLQASLADEREAVDKQAATTAEIQATAEATNKEVVYVLKSSPCASTALPSGAIKLLRK